MVTLIEHVIPFFVSTHMTQLSMELRMKFLVLSALFNSVDVAKTDSFTPPHWPEQPAYPGVTAWGRRPNGFHFGRID